MQTPTNQLFRFARLGAALLALQTLAVPAGAASASASMTVSFRVVESCEVSTSQNRNDGPRVSCAYGTPYQIGNGAVQPAMALAAAQNGAGADRVLTISF